MRILKNNRLGFCQDSNEWLYSYTLFDTKRKQQATKITCPSKVRALAEHFGMEIISPVSALKEGFFDYQKVESLSFPLPF